jgi:excisionase family DNA binding protein
MQPLLSIDVAARFLGVSKHTLNFWVSKGKIPFTKLGRRTLFNPVDLIRFVQENSFFPSDAPLSERSTSKIE